MHTTHANPRRRAPVLSALTLALLSVCASAPVWASNVCDLVDAGAGGADDGGNSAFPGDDSLICGYDNQNQGDRSTTVGYYNHALENDDPDLENNGNDNTAVGSNNDTRGAGNSGFGFNNNAMGEGNTSIGNGNYARGTHGTAVGYHNNAIGESNNAIGGGNDARGRNNTAVGQGNVAGYWDDANANGVIDDGDTFIENANAYGAGNYAQANASNVFGSGNTTVGVGSNAFGSQNLAAGQSSNAFGFAGTAAGDYSFVGGTAGVAGGLGATALGGGTGVVLDGDLPVLDVGETATVELSGRTVGLIGTENGNQFTSIDGLALETDPETGALTSWNGRPLTASEGRGLAQAVGYGGPVALGDQAIGIGAASTALGDNSLAIGYQSFANGDGNLALGPQASTSGANSVALGAGSVADRADSVSFGNADAQRQLVNVAAGSSDTDAVNLAQLSTIATAFGGGAGIAGGVFNAPTYVIQGNDYGDVGAAFVAVDGRITDLYSRITDAGGVEGPPGPPGPEGPTGPEGPAGGGPRVVTYDQDAGDTLTLKGADGTTISNVADGVTATDAVNKGQMDAGDAATLQSSRTYTDAKVAAWDDQFDTLRGDVDQRFGEQGQRINTVGALSAALALAAPDGRVRGANQFSMGVGHYRDQQAVSIGYSRLVSPRASVRVAAAFADGENAAGVGFNVGW